MNDPYRYYSAYPYDTDHIMRGVSGGHFGPHFKDEFCTIGIKCEEITNTPEAHEFRASIANRGKE